MSDYFKTNWSAMTASDWIGTLLTIIIFLLMFGMYIWVLRPKNKDKFESHRTMLLEDEADRKSENQNGSK